MSLKAVDRRNKRIWKGHRVQVYDVSSGYDRPPEDFVGTVVSVNTAERDEESGGCWLVVRHPAGEEVSVTSKAVKVLG